MAKAASIEERLAKVVKNFEVDRECITTIFDSYLSQMPTRDYNWNFMKSISDVLKGRNSRIVLEKKAKLSILESQTDMAYNLMQLNFIEESEFFTNICKEIAGKDDPDVVFLEGRIEFSKKNYKQAGKKFQQLIDQLLPGKFKDLTLFWKGECFRVQGKFEEALQKYSEIKKVRFLKVKGIAASFFEQQKYEKALKIAENEIKKRGVANVNTEIVSICLNCYFHLGKPDEFTRLKQLTIYPAAYRFVNDIALDHNCFILQDENNRKTEIKFLSIFFQYFPNQKFTTMFPANYNIFYNDLQESKTAKYQDIPLVQGRRQDMAAIIYNCFQEFFEANKERFNVSKERAEELFLKYALPEEHGVLPSLVNIPLEEFGFEGLEQNVEAYYTPRHN